LPRRSLREIREAVVGGLVVRWQIGVGSHRLIRVPAVRAVPTVGS